MSLQLSNDLFRLTGSRPPAPSSPIECVEGILARLQSRRSGESDERSAEERVEAYAADVLGWARYYLPHYFTLPASRMHRELAEELVRMVDSPDVERLALAAPRGNAKTTFLRAFILWCICYDRKKFIIYITSTADLADTFLSDIQEELLENGRIADDFPHASGRGRLWRNNVMVTRNKVRVLALGAGKKIRGRAHRQYRPDAIFVDDFEDDNHILNLEQRRKSFDWLTKAVLKARGVAQKCDFVLSGTLLHFDSVLARMLDPKRSPGWSRRIYRAVVKWADNQSLWDRWQEIYTDWHRSDYDRRRDARAFFDAHRDEMLAGTEVLWPEGEDYYTLMQQRVDDGPAAFQSEKQNEPMDPSRCKFAEEWFAWFDEEIIGGERWIVPEHGDKIPVSDCDTFGAVDPSKGRKDKSGDPAAIITIAAWPAQHLPQYQGRYRLFFILDGLLDWMHPFAIDQKIFELHQLRHYQRFGVESVQFQELFADLIRERSLADPNGATLPIVKLRPNTDKGLRIEKLISYVYSQRLQFSRRCTALYDHFRYWPQHPHDDGPDGVELCLETIGEIGWVVLDMDEGATREQLRREAEMHAHDKQLAKILPEIYDRDRDQVTCGTCIFREARGDRWFCLDRQAYIRPKDPGCDGYTADV